MNIDGTLRIMSDLSEKTISTGDIIAIVVSVISLIGVLISTYMTNKTTKKINQSNNEMQEKWNQKNIDANLIANARIEWIQKVRNISAELISLYFSILNLESIEKIQTAFNHSIEKTELLILYFGHENDKIKSKDNNILFNKENNIGKNELIVNFLISLSQKFNQYNAFIQKGGFTKLKEDINQAQQEMYRNSEMIKIGEYYHEESGEMMDVEEPQYQMYDVRRVSQLESMKKNKVNEITDLQNDLISFRNIIRTYLKIEWNKAKSVE